MAGALRHWGALACIGVLWAVSLLMPAITVDGAARLTGLDLLLQGWQGASRGVFAWYANPLFILALTLASMHRLRSAGTASGIAVVLGLTSFATEDTLRSSMDSAPPMSLRAGFYVWLCALIALFTWSWLHLYLQHRNNLRPR